MKYENTADFLSYLEFRQGITSLGSFRHIKNEIHREQYIISIIWNIYT